MQSSHRRTAKQDDIETQASSHQSGGATVIALNAATRDERGVIVI